MANLAALRAAVFSLSAKYLREADNRPPAVSGLRAGVKRTTSVHINHYGGQSYPTDIPTFPWSLLGRSRTDRPVVNITASSYISDFDKKNCL